jgi:hypothetical protein
VFGTTGSASIRRVGRRARTRSFNTVIDLVQPIAAAISVVGMSGSAASSSMIAGSTASTTEPLLRRVAAGGSGRASALRMVLRDFRRCRAIALIAIPDSWSCRISAHSSAFTDTSSSRFAGGRGARLGGHC